MTDAQPHALYRFFGDSGVLLYVGITRDMPGRMAQHQADKHWWSEVRGISIEWYPDRSAVLAAESRAVKIEQPLHNVQLRRKPTPTTGPAYGPHLAPAVTAPDELVWICDECGGRIRGADGYVHIDRRWASKAYQEHLEDEERDRATRSSSWQPRSLTAILNADEALWERHHGKCDPNPERTDYWVGISELTTARDLLRWTLHVLEKPWVYHGTNWTAFAGAMIGVDA